MAGAATKRTMCNLCGHEHFRSEPHIWDVAETEEEPPNAHHRAEIPVIAAPGAGVRRPDAPDPKPGDTPVPHRSPRSNGGAKPAPKPRTAPAVKTKKKKRARSTSKAGAKKNPEGTPGFDKRTWMREYMKRYRKKKSTERRAASPLRRRR